MLRGQTVTLCLPCRNEGAYLAAVAEAIPSYVDETIVVSNRSTDDTVEVGKSLGLTVAVDDRTTDGIGYGYALMTGMSMCTSDLLITADSDGTYPFDRIATVVGHLLDGGLDFVSCNRYPMPKGSQVPVKIRTGVRLLNLEVRLIYGLRIADILSGMWAMRRPVLDRLDLRMGDWNLSPEVKLKAFQDPAIRAEEFRIALNERHGTSHQDYLKTGLSHARWILRHRLGGDLQTVPDPEPALATTA